jgi:hypothetical protein
MYVMKIRPWWHRPLMNAVSFVFLTAVLLGSNAFTF